MNVLPGKSLNKNIKPIVAKLREIKSEIEVELIKKAIQITGDGIKRASTLCKPEMFEYELQAAIEYEMLKQGAAGPGFPSIIGSGNNSLMEYNAYTADITRTIPVSGKFTKAQKEIYNVVLETQKEVINILKIL